MPKNKISDLRNLMMETIERLIDPDDVMDAKKAVAISQLGNVIINSAKVELQAARFAGQQSPAFFQTENYPTKQIGTSTPFVASDAEMPACKCGNEIFPRDLDRSQNLKLDYPRCGSCLDLLPQNAKDLNGGGK